MSNNYARTHHQVTSGSTPTTTTTTTTFGDDHEYRHLQSGAAAGPSSAPDHTINDGGVAKDPVNPVHERTPAINPQPTTDNVSKRDVPSSSAVEPQNAPGRTGSIGETALGAVGYGGNMVERPKEEQGLGEKIMNILGA